MFNIRQTVFGFTLLAGIACAICFGPVQGQVKADDDEPKKELTIKEIMDQAHKKGLIKKVATDKASPDEKKKLHSLYKSLAKLKPSKGDQKSWDTKTKALVVAAKEAVDNKATFKTKLKAASNCANCHKVHK